MDVIRTCDGYVESVDIDPFDDVKEVASVMHITVYELIDRLESMVAEDARLSRELSSGKGRQGGATIGADDGED